MRFLLDRLSQGFHILSALALLFVGLSALYNPQSVMDLIAVKLTTTDANSSIRGVYGGGGTTLVIAIIYLMVQDLNKGLILLAMLWGFYAVSRIITIFIDGPLGSFGQQWLVIESTGFAISVLLLFFRTKLITSTTHARN